jgi:hypothetical protein
MWGGGGGLSRPFGALGRGREVSYPGPQGCVRRASLALGFVVSPLWGWGHWEGTIAGEDSSVRNGGLAHLNPILQVLEGTLFKFQAHVSNPPSFQRPGALRFSS